MPALRGNLLAIAGKFTYIAFVSLFPAIRQAPSEPRAKSQVPAFASVELYHGQSLSLVALSTMIQMVAEHQNLCKVHTVLDFSLASQKAWNPRICTCDDSERCLVKAASICGSRIRNSNRQAS
jgi:hypothetical protein